MSVEYLVEFADSAMLALSLAERESTHLHYTYRTLFTEAIDLIWVVSLANREDLAEKIDAFVGRFGRLQDQIGEKLFPAFARLTGGQPKSLLDAVAFAERMAWLDNAEAFIGARRLRNLLVHEYMTDPKLFLEAIEAARPATEHLMGIVATMKQEAVRLGLYERTK